MKITCNWETKKLKVIAGSLYLSITCNYLLPSIGISQSSINVNKSTTRQPFLDSYSLSGAMRGLSVKEGSNFAKTFGLDIGLNGEKNWTDSLGLVLSIGATFETGAHDYVLIDDYRPKNQLGLDEAYVFWRPLKESVSISFGALNQSKVNNPQVVSHKSFPGALETFSLDVGSNIRVSALATQTIAYSTNADDTRRETQDSSPGFYYEEIGVSYSPSEYINAKISAGHFLYDNLPSSIAYYSRGGGNTVTGTGKEGSKFKYAFQGTTARASLATQFNTSEVSVYSNFAKNNKAPSGLNEAYIYGLKGEKSFSKSLIALYGQAFRTEKDVSPSEYNSKVLGHNNRQGSSGGASLELKEANLLLSFTYTRANLIEDNSLYQDLFQYYTISLRTSHL